MKRNIISLTLLSMLLFSACAAPVGVPVPTAPPGESRAILDLHAQYRSASLVISGVCVSDHKTPQGEACSDIEVAEVLAGEAEVGSVVHCKQGAMQQGEEYLLFLETGADVNHAEDTPGYTLLSEQMLPISKGEVIWNGNHIPMDTIRGEMAELQETINTLRPVYYYTELSALAQAADEIFIGRVISAPALQRRAFSIKNGGSVEKAQYDTSIVTVETYGDIKGALAYGKQIQMVYSPDCAAGMLNAATLQPVDLKKGAVPALCEGGIYLFFLSYGPDSKQPYLFPVNPVQGYVQINGEELYARQENEPLRVYSALTPLVAALQRELAETIEVPQNPTLIIE